MECGELIFFFAKKLLFIIVSIGSGLEKIIKANTTPPSFFEIIASKEIYLPLIFLNFLFELKIKFWGQFELILKSI